jgi:transposase InsO family protein
LVLPLSKTIQLGVIILALQFLRNLRIPFLPRIVRKAADLFGVSRKSGYQAARRIREILQHPPVAGPDQNVRREVLRLRIRTQVLTFERDHPGIRFDERHSHLPLEAKSLCVRILRDFQGELSGSEIAGALGVPLPSLVRWDAEADGQARFPSKPERRGIHRRAGPEDVRRVLDEFQALTQDVTLEEFTASFNQRHPEHSLDRRTITRILQANGLRKIETRTGPEPYHPPFQVYFPGAQVAIDAKRSGVVFKSEPERVFTVTKEVGIDLASAAILGDALGKTETSDGVERVLVQVHEEYRSVLALLSDNGSANRAADPKAIFQWAEDRRIFSFPYHPQTNGHLEGLFGQFVRIVGRIEIDDSTKETLASSIVAVIWRVFIHFHNHSPRERLGGQSPLEYFRRYAPSAEEVEAARKGLRSQGERSRASRDPHPRLADCGFRSRVESILRRHRLAVQLDGAVRALLPYDLRVIESASAALLIQSQRDGFDERKRTFAYFMGIVRKKQQDVDAERRRSHHLAHETAKRLEEIERDRRVVEKERLQEEEDLRVQPEKVVLWYCGMLLSGGLKLGRGRWLEGLRRGLQGLRRLGRATRAVLERLAGTIRSWGKFQEKLKEEMVKLLFEEWELVLAGFT